MAKKTNNATDKRPRPPEDLDGEAFLEWNRLCDELEAVGRLEKADRAIILLAAQTYANWMIATQHVAKYGTIVKAHNGVAGRNPYYGVQKETSVLLRGLYADLGLTPATRLRNATAMKGENEGNEPLDF
jgi:P27 family predicted phage terminase small subunit